MYISRVRINNIRCFDRLDIRFQNFLNNPSWTVIVGDNATGKTALLKSIAIGLCDVSSAAGLLRESDSGYIRHGKNEGRIVIELTDPSNKEKHYKIYTTIENVPIRTGVKKEHYERVTQKTSPPYQKFPWGKIFACGYGAGRGTMGTGDITGYSVINAVYNMFNYSEGLQNPELTFRRVISNHPDHKSELFRYIQSIFEERTVSGETHKVSLSSTGILVDGPWGKDMPLRDLADGYKSTFLWITDFLGWALSFNPKIKSLKDIKGIIVIDELEEHLHPKWQKSIVKSLRDLFPQVQFITSTHSSLITSSILKKSNMEENFSLLHFSLKSKNRVRDTNLSGSVIGQDIDQLLGSKAFDYLTNYDPDVENIFRVASELASLKRRSPREEKEYKRVKDFVSKYVEINGITPIEKIIKDEKFDEIKKKTLALLKKNVG